MKKKIIIVATHPIQYQIPWFRALNNISDIDLTVLFGLIPDSAQQSIGFGNKFTWDIPMMEGYKWKLLSNTSKNPQLGTFSGISCPEIKNTFAEITPDAVILTGWHSKMLIQAALYAKLSHIFLILRGESNAMLKRAWYKRIIHRTFFSLIDAFISIGTSNKQFYLQNGVLPKKIHESLYFVDNERFLATSILSIDKQCQLRKEFSIKQNSFCFIYSGKLIEKKNVMELLLAFNELYQKHQPIHLLIIGDGEQKNYLQNYAVQNNLPVTFSGFVNQSKIPQIYSIGNCFLLASNYGETWGLVVNEAMLCGLPAIISDRVGCGPDLIVESKTGFIYQFRNIEHLVELMGFMVINPVLAKKMGNNARSHVVHNSNVEKVVSATIKIAKEVNSN